MTIVSWRNATLVLAAVCSYQSWRGCSRSQPAATQQVADDRRLGSHLGTITSLDSAGSHDAPERSLKGSERASQRDPASRTIFGIKVPGWLARLAPQPGEKLRDYRDRVLPLAELAIAPQRARVARIRDELALEPRQRVELDAAVQEAATAIQDRVMSGIASGELRPATFTPMAGIEVARDVLGIVDRGNTRFLTTLTPEQRTQLASQRFDFADYLLFSARWEDALKPLD